MRRFPRIGTLASAHATRTQKQSVSRDCAHHGIPFAAPRPSALALVKEVLDAVISDLIDDDVLNSVIDELATDQDQAPELFSGAAADAANVSSGLGGEGEGDGEGKGEEDLTPSEAEAAAEDAEGFASEKAADSLSGAAPAAASMAAKSGGGEGEGAPEGTGAANTSGNGRVLTDVHLLSSGFRTLYDKEHVSSSVVSAIERHLERAGHVPHGNSSRDRLLVALRCADFPLDEEDAVYLVVAQRLRPHPSKGEGSTDSSSEHQICDMGTASLRNSKGQQRVCTLFSVLVHCTTQTARATFEQSIGSSLSYSDFLCLCCPPAAETGGSIKLSLHAAGDLCDARERCSSDADVFPPGRNEWVAAFFDAPSLSFRSSAFPSDTQFHVGAEGAGPTTGGAGSTTVSSELEQLLLSGKAAEGGGGDGNEASRPRGDERLHGCGCAHQPKLGLCAERRTEHRRAEHRRTELRRTRFTSCTHRSQLRSWLLKWLRATASQANCQPACTGSSCR